MAKHYVAAGKTTLCRAVAAQLHWACELEADGARNPFLRDYYADPRRWCLASQMFFLVEACAQQARIAATDGGVIQDRVLDEHLQMFSVPKFEAGELLASEFALLRDLVETVETVLPSPDLLLYARASPEAIFERIRGRGRDYEQHFTLADVIAECARYEQFVCAYSRSPVLEIDVLRVDARTDAGAREIADTIIKALDSRS
jgi:deoxyadenosine/deoxycytidine kinase